MNPRESTNWRRPTGDSAEIEWAGATWTLGFDEGRFGLRRAGEAGERLALLGLAAVGRRDDRAFTPDCLAGVELLHARLLATFEPVGWNGLTVRAAWGPSRDGRAMDLEIQASTSTVGELRRLEVLVGSRFEGQPQAGSQVVTARDRASASLTYDGRESDEALARLRTLAVPTSPPSIEGAGGYLELVHPQDVSRMIVDGGGDAPAAEVAYALFGYDLEKGVVLRGRLRGVWLAGSTPDAAAAERRRFLEEPPPLRTA